MRVCVLKKIQTEKYESLFVREGAFSLPVLAIFHVDNPG